MIFSSSHIKGIVSEIYVLGFLIIKGYRPIKWRMRNVISEIDLIVKKNKILIAIEVKYRKDISQGLISVHKQQQNKIRKALEIFSFSYNQNYHSLRCDVCIVTHKGFIKHLKNAF